eukprot:SAG11_NODE_2975_length_2798_cov_1.751019_3_plen_114_part_00
MRARRPWPPPLLPQSSNSATDSAHARVLPAARRGPDARARASAHQFNVIDDPTEHIDLAEAQPAVVERLLERLEALQPAVYDPDRGAPETAAACAQVRAGCARMCFLARGTPA